MAFLFINVKKITPYLSPEQTDQSKVQAPGWSIPACNGLLTPLVLKQTGPETYTVISGQTTYDAALKAHEINPRKGEMVHVFGIPPNAGEAVIRQLEVLELCR